MANLPTAYASQNFGRKTLDFYAASGEVSGSDPRARADERSLTDYDGAKHTVRVMDRDFALEAGDQASVLRMQTGPSQRSRPVALVNHTQKGWSRTHPGASALLSRAGVARNVNWFLTVLLFALASIVMVWPALRTFLVEVDPSLFGGLPQFDLFALALSALPDLGNWSFSSSVAPISGLIAQGGSFAAEHADAIVFYGLSGLAALTVFATRSWRLLWAPLFVGLVGAAALGLGGVAEAAGYAVGAYGLAALIFVIGGLVNRIRDAARLERRIALLADHLERHPPEETIARSDTPEEAPAETPNEDDADLAANDDAPVAIAVPVSAALSESADDADTESVMVEAEEETESAAEAPSESQAEVSVVEPAETEAEPDAETAEDASEGPAEETEPALAIEEEVAVEQDLAVLEEAEAEAEADVDAVEAEADDAQPVSEDAVLTEETTEPVLSEADADDMDPIVEATSEDEATAQADSEAEVEAEATSETEPDALSGDAEGVSADTEVETHADAEAMQADSDEALEPALSADAPVDAEPQEAELELAGLDAEEAERMKSDPRYAARAIVLPSPPPMPSAEADAEADAEDTDTVAASTGPVTRETRELRPSAPLTNRVLSLFSNPPVPPAPPAPPAPSRTSEDEEA